ncbi:MAG TPA: UDP-N-acetyl-D-glucosamine dehydrogenase, partial [Ktedonobacter sp.]|nr:UDP-N-acetyl-D-glucosamine dehydrogenase [Ktedonobacter sp.]
SATREVQAHLHPGQLIILESTTYPGTTDEVVLPALESTGMKVGVDFFLAFSP